MDNYIDHIFDSIDSNIKLDENQKKVVLDDSQNLLVVAGAGSGKTITIIAKVKYLVEKKNIRPSDILILSFTNKTVDELKEKVNIKFDIGATITTFHKLAYEIIKETKEQVGICTDDSTIIANIIKKNKNTNKTNKILRKEKTYRKKDNKYINGKYIVVFASKVIKLIKTTGIDLHKLSSSNKRTKQFIEYIKDINNKYKNVMTEKKIMDFDDFIIKATDSLTRLNLKFKYILVDEYQDVSSIRFNFINELRKKCNAKMIVVGDDFQTIYSFAGSNMSLFLEYEEMLNAKVIKIVNTYRSSQELISIAGKFVMENKEQLKKELTSNRHVSIPIEIHKYKRNKASVLETILDKIIFSNPKSKILLLGRYNHDINVVLNDSIKNKDNRIKYKNYKNIIDFMTVHSSKGLEYDDVILINADNDVIGFPSKIKEDSIIKELFKNISTIEEERRLFYVALTRAKDKVYIITKIGSESEFVIEISKYENVLCTYKIKNKHKLL